MLLSSLSLNLFCRFLTCFSHQPPTLPPSPHPLGTSNTRARLHTRAQMHNTHTLKCTLNVARLETHMLACRLSRSEDWFPPSWHLKGATAQPDTWIHMASFTTPCQSVVCVSVCVSAVHVHAGCPLRCVEGWGEDGGCHRRLHVLRVSHQLFLDGPQRFRRSWRCWMSLLTYMMHNARTVNATHLYVHVYIQDSCRSPGRAKSYVIMQISL